MIRLTLQNGPVFFNRIQQFDGCCELFEWFAECPRARSRKSSDIFRIKAEALYFDGRKGHDPRSELDGEEISQHSLSEVRISCQTP